MLSVTFQGPIIVEADKLAALLSLAGVPATVEPVVEGKKPRKANGTNGHANGHAEPTLEYAPNAEKAPDSVTTVAPVEDAPPAKKRGRKSNAEKAAAAAASGGQLSEPADAAPAADPAPAKHSEATGVNGAAVATGANFDALRDRFAGLIDKDYDGALNLLQKYGVDRFGALPEKDFAAFAADLDDVGV